MLPNSFYYYSLASPDHLREGAYRLNIIIAAISSLIRKALKSFVLLESTSPAPAVS